MQIEANVIDTNKTIEFIKGTVLSDMSDRSVLMYNTEINEHGKEVKKHFISNYNEIYDDIEQHAEIVAKAIEGHLDYARTVVKPAVLEFHEITKPVLDGITAKLAPVNYSLRIVDLPNCLKHNGILSDIDKFKNVVTIDSINNTPIVVQTDIDFSDNEEEFKKYIKNENGPLNALVDADLLTIKDVSLFLQNGFKTLFNTNTLGQKYDSYIYKDIAELALLFVAANNLNNNPPVGITLSLDEYNGHIIRIMSFIANIILKKVKGLELAIEKNILICSIVEKEVFVVGDIYRSFIEAGGSNDIIYGITLTNLHNKCVNESVSRCQELVGFDNALNAFNNLCVTEQRLFDEQKIKMKRNALNVLLKDFVNKNYDKFDIEESNIYNVLYAAESFINSLRVKDVDDSYKVSLDIVAQYVFGHTNAHFILTGIEEAFGINPDIHIREAVTLTTIKYVCDYIGNMIDVS